MTTAALPRRSPLAPQLFDQILAAACVLMMVAVTVAVVRGSGEWSLVPRSIWLHLSTVYLALALTPAMLLRKRGDRVHRWLGYVWLAAMLATSLISFDIRLMRHGQLGPIHLLSIGTIIACIRLLMQARNHRAADHRRTVRVIVLVALLTAGFFTFPFDRILGQWLAGVPAIHHLPETRP